MSNKARRYGQSAPIESFDWGQGFTPAHRHEPMHVPPPSMPAAPAVDTAAIEKTAFLKGYQQGERAGLEAGAAKGEQILRRLASSLDELQTLRGELLRRTERQVVELAIAMARRVVHRELALDPDLLLAMARVALDRLADTASATIRLHPEDFASAVGRGQPSQTPGGVRIVSDPTIARGGCLVQSDYGVIDVTADVQLDELAHTLLGDGTREAPAVDSHAA
ncbi:MAG: hypothetical protein IT178_01960 [Acidobacteria bacterium]|nr:hypothetical protein [Acidobacteriota bacterium]